MGAARPSLPETLARRLDRLSLAAHRFHRFAHHPLCEEYASEVFRLGRKTRVCKGCTLAGLGAASGLVVGGFAPLLPGWALAGLAFGVVPIFAGAYLFFGKGKSAPPPTQGSPQAEALSASHRVPPKRGKLLTRTVPTVVFAFIFMQGLRVGGGIGSASAILAAGFSGSIVFAYRRRGPQRLPCQTCPERFEMNRCRGFREILRRERAFQRQAGRLIHGAGTASRTGNSEAWPNN